MYHCMVRGTCQRLCIEAPAWSCMVRGTCQRLCTGGETHRIGAYGQRHLLEAMYRRLEAPVRGSVQEASRKRHHLGACGQRLCTGVQRHRLGAYGRGSVQEARGTGLELYGQSPVRGCVQEARNTGLNVWLVKKFEHENDSFLRGSMVFRSKKCTFPTFWQLL